MLPVLPLRSPLRSPLPVALAASVASLALLAGTGQAVGAATGPAASSAPASTTATPLPPWRTTPTVHPSRHRVRVLDLRYARHPRFDRVVVDLRGHRPGYRIRYVRRLVQDGSGKPVRLHGRKKVALVLNPAYAHNRRGEVIYAGPRHVRLDFPTLRGIAFTGDFEGYVSFGFGTDRRAPYRIFTLHHPTRLVVDFKH